MQHEAMLHVLRNPQNVSPEVLQTACWQAADHLLLASKPASANAATINDAEDTLSDPIKTAVANLRQSLQSFVLRAAQVEQFAAQQEQLLGVVWSLLTGLMQLTDVPGRWRDANGAALDEDQAFVHIRDVLIGMVMQLNPEAISDAPAKS